MLIDSVFDADLEYDIGFESVCFFYDRIRATKSSKTQKNHTLNTMWANMFHVINSFSRCKIGSFVALENGYRMVKIGTT